MGASAPPRAFQLVILPAKMSWACRAVMARTLLAGLTTRATPSMAKGKLCRPYLAISFSLRARPVLPICTRPSPTCCTPTPEPPPATVMRMSGLAVMMFLAAPFMTGMWAVPPAISSVPERPLKLSRGAAWDVMAKIRPAIRAGSRKRQVFMMTSRMGNVGCCGNSGKRAGRVASNREHRQRTGVCSWAGTTAARPGSISGHIIQERCRKAAGGRGWAAS